MIGALLAMKFIGNKKWIPALIFWAVIMVIGYLGMPLVGTLIPIAFVTLILSAMAFILIAHYWYQLPWMLSFITYIVAFAIDLAIMFVIFIALGWNIFSYIGISGVGV
jgi:hypothetical protein